MRKFELEAYDGSIVTVPEDKVKAWKEGQEKIKNLLAQGVSQLEIIKKIQKGEL